jgi:Recombinase
VSWPDLHASPYPGECWAIEAELTPKPLARTASIMAGLLARTTDYYPDSVPAAGPRYHRVVYLAAPAARGVTERAAASLPPPLATRVTVRDLPPGSEPVSILWAYVQFRVIVWLLRTIGRVLLWTALLAVLVAAAPFTLVAAIGLAGAWLRGWPPARLRRAAAWALPMTAVYLAGRAMQARTWQAFALAPVRDYMAAWHALAAGRGVVAFVLVAPVAVPAGLAAAGGLWAWRIYALDTGLSGRTATAPVVAQIFTWRAVDKLGVTTITNLLNADPGRCPSPKPGGWTAGGVYAILRNPKYTGHMVYGRRRSSGSRRFHGVPQDQWIWSPQPAHPAIITRQIWDTAQTIGAEHASARDDPGMASHPATRRSYLLRSRCRCRDCKRRMIGRLVRPYQGHPGYIYYSCPHNPANPRHQAAAPTTPAPSASEKTTYSPSSASSSPPTCSAPTARPCSPPASPPPPQKTPPARSRRPPGCTNGCGRSTPPRTTMPAKSRTSPPCRRTPRQSPRYGRGSSPGSPNWKPNGPRSTSGLPHWTGPPASVTSPLCWTRCRCWGTSSPMPPPASRPGCSPPSA